MISHVLILILASTPMVFSVISQVVEALFKLGIETGALTEECKTEFGEWYTTQFLFEYKLGTSISQEPTLVQQIHKRFAKCCNPISETIKILTLGSLDSFFLRSKLIYLRSAMWKETMLEQPNFLLFRLSASLAKVLDSIYVEVNRGMQVIENIKIILRHPAKHDVLNYARKHHVYVLSMIAACGKHLTISSTECHMMRSIYNQVNACLNQLYSTMQPWRMPDMNSKCILPEAVQGTVTMNVLRTESELVVQIHSIASDGFTVNKWPVGLLMALSNIAGDQFQNVTLSVIDTMNQAFTKALQIDRFDEMKLQCSALHYQETSCSDVDAQVFDILFFFHHGCMNSVSCSVAVPYIYHLVGDTRATRRVHRSLFPDSFAYCYDLAYVSNAFHKASVCMRVVFEAILEVGIVGASASDRLALTHCITSIVQSLSNEFGNYSTRGIQQAHFSLQVDLERLCTSVARMGLTQTTLVSHLLQLIEGMRRLEYNSICSPGAFYFPSIDSVPCSSCTFILLIFYLVAQVMQRTACIILSIVDISLQRKAFVGARHSFDSYFSFFKDIYDLFVFWKLNNLEIEHGYIMF